MKVDGAGLANDYAAAQVDWMHNGWEWLSCRLWIRRGSTEGGTIAGMVWKEAEGVAAWSAHWR